MYTSRVFFSTVIINFFAMNRANLFEYAKLGVTFHSRCEQTENAYPGLCGVCLLANERIRNVASISPRRL